VVQLNGVGHYRRHARYDG